jgi:IS1 family transposase
MDELWSFVFMKMNEKRVILAREAHTTLIVGLHVGARDGRGIRALFNSLEGFLKEKARFFTDNWKAYLKVLPKQRHEAGKGGLMNYHERFNLTLRQTTGRIVRKTLSFSKSTKNHLGALLFRINHFNQQLSLTL